MREFKINDRIISPSHPPYIVAELSANHNGKLSSALESITEAKKRGADAIKLQTYSADTMTLKSDKKDFLISEGPWKGYTLYELYQQAQTPFEWHEELFHHAKKIGITCFSTPFDESAVDLLESLGTPAYKVASFELTDLPLIHHIASKQKPIILSTGMASLKEISEAVNTARAGGCEDIIILHCISSYPAPIEQFNLHTITDLQTRFDLPIGLSDHSLTHTAATTSVALGACFIEKHFILDRHDKGPDSGFSITPKELESLCQECNDTWLSLGKAGYEVRASEAQNLNFRRSIYFVKNLKKGDIITDQHIRKIRPGYGLSPKYYSKIIGKRVTQDVEAGVATTSSLIDNF